MADSIDRREMGAGQGDEGVGGGWGSILSCADVSTLLI